MRNIAIIAGVFPARSETFVREHAVGMARRGWQPTVLAQAVGPAMSESELSEIDATGVRRHYAGELSKNRSLRALQMGAAFLRHPGQLAWVCGKDAFPRATMLSAAEMVHALKRIDVAITHIHYGTYAARLEAAGWDRPSIVTWHGYDANVVPRKRGAGMYRALFERDWWHTAGSEFMRDRLIELGCRAERIVKIPMGVVLSRFAFVDRSERDHQGLKIVSVGRLDEVKGHGALIAAMGSLKRKGYDASLRIVGEGPLRMELEGQINQEGVSEVVTLLGAQRPEAVQRELAAADLFALTGRKSSDGAAETQGVVYMEAQATGLPVVACRVGGVSESLVDGQTGMLVESGDVPAIADALQTYADDRSMRLNHGKAAREFVLKRFDIETMLDAFEKLYSR